MARRLGAKVEHHAGDQFPRVGFIVTNLTPTNRAAVRFFNKPGTVEQWIKEGKQAVGMTRLGCHRFRSNEVRLRLSVIAYNFGNLWRLGPPRWIDLLPSPSRTFPLQHLLFFCGCNFPICPANFFTLKVRFWV